MEIITLSNGKKVGNFSSPHPFTFEDGSVLPAVSPEEAERLKIIFIEESLDNAISGDIRLSFEISKAVDDAMYEWRKLYDKCLVDVVFCPLPMIEAIKDSNNGYSKHYLFISPFRAIRMEDRIKKLVSIHKQCV